MNNNHEIENLEEKITQSIRLKGSYSMPVSAVYAPALKILESMKSDGLVKSETIGRSVVYTATDKMKKTIIVREISAEKVKVGQSIGQKRGDFVSKINQRSKELNLDDINFYGIVRSIETKMFPKNIWEVITFQKNAKKTVIRFKNSKIVVDPTTELLKVK